MHDSPNCPIVTNYWPIICPVVQSSFSYTAIQRETVRYAEFYADIRLHESALHGFVCKFLASNIMLAQEQNVQGTNRPKLVICSWETPLITRVAYTRRITDKMSMDKMPPGNKATGHTCNATETKYHRTKSHWDYTNINDATGHNIKVNMCMVNKDKYIPPVKIIPSGSHLSSS